MKRTSKILAIILLAALLAIVSHWAYLFYEETRRGAEYLFTAVAWMFIIGAMPVAAALWGSEIEW